MGFMTLFQGPLLCMTGTSNSIKMDESRDQFVSGTLYKKAKRATRRLLVLLEDLRRIYFRSWTRVMHALENAFYAVEYYTPASLHTLCTLSLSWTDFGDAISDGFLSARKINPTFEDVSTLNSRLIRQWRENMALITGFVSDYVHEAPSTAAVSVHREYGICRSETRKLLQLTPECLVNYMNMLKTYTKKNPKRQDEKRYLDEKQNLFRSIEGVAST